jgi:hypothetical protein
MPPISGRRSATGAAGSPLSCRIVRNKPRASKSLCAFSAELMLRSATDWNDMKEAVPIASFSVSYGPV